MKILLLTPDIEKRGGVANYYRTLRSHLNSSVEYLTVGTRSDDRCGMHGCRRMLRDYLTLWRKLKSGHYNIVHLNPSLMRKAIVRDALSCILAKIYGVRVIVFIRGWDEAYERIVRRHFLLPFRLVYFQADSFIVLGSKFRDSLVEMGCHKPIYIETTVVPDEIFANPPSDAHRQRVSAQEFNILFLARIEKDKGIYETVDAFRILLARYSFVRMTIVGDGLELGEVREYVRIGGIEGITFGGYVCGEAKASAFTNADVYVFPTMHGEGMPNSLLEAMAYGLPVITRPVGGVADFFEHGKMGFLTESKEPSIFAELLERLVTNEPLRKQMGDYNRSYAYDRFRASQVAKRLINIYGDVLAEDSQSAIHSR